MQTGGDSTYTISTDMKALLENVRRAGRSLALVPDTRRNEVLLRVADAMDSQAESLVSANEKDLARMSPDSPLYDRLLLTPQRIHGMASDMRQVAALPSPLGKLSCERTLPNGLHLRRVSVPFGVVGVIYESRPNVSSDVFALCFKSGNACVLKGGKDADHSNRAIVSLIQETLAAVGIDPQTVVLLPATHEATAQMLNAVGYIDLCIPRGGKNLISFVRDNARVPVIETGAGVVHAYFDKAGDLRKGRAIVANAKMRRVSVCNALDCLLVHKDREADIASLLEPMQGKVRFHLHVEAEDFDWGREWMSYDLSVCMVSSMDEALEHIMRYGSGHSECIVTEDEAAAARFQREVDAACVYVNAPTSFTDGAQFGLGAEIGISTQKLGPRGPMGLEELTTYKWLINGDGQIRE